MFTINPILLTHPITPVKELTIDRSLWYRGQGGDSSKLERTDGRRCCIGFYALACGLTRKEILCRTYLSTHGDESVPPPHEAAWLDELMPDRTWDYGISATIGYELAMINDNELMPEPAREVRIAELFMRHGNVRVTLVN